MNTICPTAMKVSIRNGVGQKVYKAGDLKKKKKRASQGGVQRRDTIQPNDSSAFGLSLHESLNLDSTTVKPFNVHWLSLDAPCVTRLLSCQNCIYSVAIETNLNVGIEIVFQALLHHHLEFWSFTMTNKSPVRADLMTDVWTILV